jgi:hypothetical protein
MPTHTLRAKASSQPFAHAVTPDAAGYGSGRRGRTVLRALGSSFRAIPFAPVFPSLPKDRDRYLPLYRSCLSYEHVLTAAETSMGRSGMA